MLTWVLFMLQLLLARLRSKTSSFCKLDGEKVSFFLS